MNGPNKRLYILIFCLFITAIPSASAETGDFDNGLQSYKSGSYETALLYFMAASITDPNNSILHYYLANTYIDLGRSSEAISEYQKAYSLSTDENLRDSCKTALAKYDKTLSATRHTISRPLNQQLIKSVSTIKGQTDQAKSYTMQSAQTEADSTLKGTALRNQTIQENTRDQVHDIENDYFSKNPLAAQQGAQVAQDIVYKAAKKMTTIKTNGEAQANAQMTLGINRSRYLEQTAMNLEESLVGPINHNDIILTPVGTNLYVRNYISAPASSIIPGQIIPSCSLTTEGLFIKHEPVKEDNQDSHIDLNVRGKLIDNGTH